MKTIIIRIFILIVFSLFLLNCEEEKFQFDDNEYYTHCLLIEGNQPRIIVGRTLDVFPKYSFNIVYQNDNSDFNIFMTKNGEQIQGIKREDYDIEHERYIDYFPLAMNDISYSTYDNAVIGAGDLFTIQVDILYLDIEIIKTITAQTVIPQHIPVELESFKDDEDDANLNSVNYKLSFIDPANQNNFYYLLPFVVFVPKGLEVNNINMDSLWNNPKNYPGVKISHNNVKMIVGLSDESTLSSYTSYDREIGYVGNFFNDNSFDGEEKSFVFYVDINYIDEDRDHYLFFQLYHITEDFYKYYTTILNQNNTQLDVYSEPVQLYTNVQNGLGLFAGASLTEENILIQPNP